MVIYRQKNYSISRAKAFYKFNLLMDKLGNNKIVNRLEPIANEASLNLYRAFTPANSRKRLLIERAGKVKPQRLTRLQMARGAVNADWAIKMANTFPGKVANKAIEYSIENPVAAASQAVIAPVGRFGSFAISPAFGLAYNASPIGIGTPVLAFSKPINDGLRGKYPKYAKTLDRWKVQYPKSKLSGKLDNLSGEQVDRLIQMIPTI